MNAKEDINIGYKLQHLVPAFFIVLIGGLLAFTHYSFTIVLGLIGIAILCMRSGIEIDTKNKRIRKYNALLKLKLGFWVDLKYYSRVELCNTSESQTFTSRVSSTTVRAKTYDLIFYKDNGASFEFHDFLDYPIALKVFKIVSIAFGLTNTNQIEEMRQNIKQRERR